MRPSELWTKGTLSGMKSATADQHGHNQGRIYIGARGYMAPGPEVPGGHFEDKNKNWESYFIKFEGAPGPN